MPASFWFELCLLRLEVMVTPTHFLGDTSRFNNLSYEQHTGNSEWSLHLMVEEGNIH